jgi:hypothetical protein
LGSFGRFSGEREAIFDVILGSERLKVAVQIYQLVIGRNDIIKDVLVIARLIVILES